MFIEKDIISALHKFKFFGNRPRAEDIIPEDKLEGFVTLDNCVMVVPKLYSVKKQLQSITDIEPKKFNMKLDYKVILKSDQQLKKEDVITRMTTDDFSDTQIVDNKVNIGTEFLKVFLKMVTKTKDEYVTIYTKQDYPLMIECTELKIIFAPRNDLK